jgi:prefoldin beta subunit
VAAVMAEDSLSPELQQKIQTLQGLGQQLQSVGQQRQQMDLLKSETERARKAMEALAEDAVVYRNIGAFMVQDDRNAALTRLTDDGETLEIRLKRAKDQEAQMQGQFESLQAELQKALGPA